MLNCFIRCESRNRGKLTELITKQIKNHAPRNEWVKPLHTCMHVRKLYIKSSNIRMPPEITTSW